MLSEEDVRRLKNAGFIDYEIYGAEDSFLSHETSSTTSPAWQIVIESRRGWTEGKYNIGWTTEEIDNTIMDYYVAKEGRSPFDFLKAEYLPSLKLDYQEALRKRKQKETAQLYRK